MPGNPQRANLRGSNNLTYTFGPSTDDNPYSIQPASAEDEDYDYEMGDYQDDVVDNNLTTDKLALCQQTFLDTQSKTGCPKDNYCNYGSLNCIGKDLFCDDWVSNPPPQKTPVQIAIDQSILSQKSEVMPDRCGVFSSTPQ
jgi:hypothetical protein